MDHFHGVAQTGSLDDDTHLFELTEKSNNTCMALSYWNHQHSGVQQRAATTPHTDTQGPTPEMTYRGAPITAECQEEDAAMRTEDDISNNALSINFKNSIYSKIQYDPSVHNLAPSMISARHQPLHSDASASQISTMGLTSKTLGRQVQTYRNGGSAEDAESEVPSKSFLKRHQKLLSSSSSPEIDIDDVMRR